MAALRQGPISTQPERHHWASNDRNLAHEESSWLQLEPGHVPLVVAEGEVRRTSCGVPAALDVPQQLMVKL
eukprot:4167736-Alexandrium_andersonii.AAC.1